MEGVVTEVRLAGAGSDSLVSVHIMVAWLGDAGVMSCR